MRIAVVTMAVCFSITSLASAGDVKAAIREPTQIAAQPLGPALKELARSRGLQVLYFSDTVRDLHTQGAAGDITADEAFDQLLEGTGLAHRFIDDQTVSVFPLITVGAGAASAANSRPPVTAAEARKEEGKRESSARFRVAQMDQGAPAVVDQQADRASSGNPAQLEEIVVTAQKRQQRLQDVPVSLSVVTGEEIEAKGVTRLSDLQYSIPGLSIFSTQGPGQEVIQIGGVSNVNGLATVGVYLDEMAINGGKVQGGPSGSNLDVRLLDMARVEVLRGPQGTLYGEGSMGGTIRYVTQSPDLTGYSGSVEAEGGHITGGAESYKANGVLNLPLIEDRLGLRLLAAYERNGGWIDNTATGQSNINGVDLKTFRGNLLARPTEALELSVLYLHQNTDQRYAAFGIDGQQSSAVQTNVHDRYDLVNVALKYDLGSVQILNSAGYLDRPADTQLDITPLFLPFLEAPPPSGFGLPPGLITGIPFGLRSTQEVLTDELRFSSARPGSLNWTAGAYYRSARTRTDQATSTSPGQLPFALLQSVASGKSAAFAVFGDVSYELTEQLTAEIGARYYRDEQHADASRNVAFGFPTDLAARDATFHSFNPRFNLSYEFSSTSMVYVNAAKGFRSGGFNSTIAPGIPLTYEPDELWHYELGTKQQLLDRKLEIAADVYYTDWKNVQTTVLIQPGNLAVTENSGKVNGWGADLSLTGRPMDGLSLTGTFGWNDLAYAEGTASSLNFPGDPVDEAVQLSYSASLDYRRPVFGDTAGFFHADYQHAGPARLTQRSQNVFVDIPEHGRTNVRAGLDFGRYEAAVYATNLFDDRSVLFPVAPGSPFNVEQVPRTVGVNLRARF